MPAPKATLKARNAVYLWTFICANFAVFFAVIIGSQLDYASLDQFWRRVSAKNGIMAACMPVLALVLNGVVGDVAKARLAFWRWKNPLPGCRAFSNLIHSDPRVDVTALKQKYGTLPRSPKDQNVLWFQIYKKHAEALTVREAHRVYLLTRDMAAISAFLTMVFSTTAFFSSIQVKTAFLYSGGLVMQYLILAASARNYGNRFVLNVLTEESHQKTARKQAKNSEPSNLS